MVQSWHFESMFLKENVLSDEDIAVKILLFVMWIWFVPYIYKYRPLPSLFIWASYLVANRSQAQVVWSSHLITRKLLISGISLGNVYLSLPPSPLLPFIGSIEEVDMLKFQGRLIIHIYECNLNLVILFIFLCW